MIKCSLDGVTVRWWSFRHTVRCMHVCVRIYSTMYMFRTIQFLWCNFKRLVSIRLAGWSGTMQAIILSLQRQNNDATTIISNIFTFSGFCFVFFSVCCWEKLNNSPENRDRSQGRYWVFLWFHIRNENNTDFWCVLWIGIAIAIIFA